MLSSTTSISQWVDTLAPPEAVQYLLKVKVPALRNPGGGRREVAHTMQGVERRGWTTFRQPHRLAGPRHVPHAFHPPCSGSDAPLAGSTALRIRRDQTRDNTNEVAFAADSSCKERRSQSSQLEGNEMQLNSGQAGEEKRGTAETGLMQLLRPQVWIYHYSARWPAATGERDSPCRGATSPAGLPGGNQGR